MEWKATAFQGVIAGGTLAIVSQWLLANLQAKRERAARFLDERRAAYVALLRLATQVLRLSFSLCDGERRLDAALDTYMASTRAVLNRRHINDSDRERLKEIFEAFDSASSSEERFQAYDALGEALSSRLVGSERQEAEHTAVESNAATKVETTIREPHTSESGIASSAKELESARESVLLAESLNELVGSAEVKAAAHVLVEAIADEEINADALLRMTSARKQFVKAARKDLGAR